MSRVCLGVGGFLACAVALWLSPATAQAQFSCSGSIDPHINTPGPYQVGDVLEVHVTVGVNDIAGGTEIEITQVDFDLDCFNDGGFPCTDEGDIVEYEGDGTLTTTCAGVTVASNVPGGGSATNELNFVFTPALTLPPNSSCDVRFFIKILSLGVDGTPSIIEEAAKFIGSCDNGLVGDAGGTVAFAVSQPCCLPDGTCELLPCSGVPGSCEDLGGTCEPIDTACTEPEACCFPDGTCLMMDPLCCEEQGGIPEGPGSVCGGAPEACCLPDNTCITVDPLCCTLQFGGTPEGPGSVCTEPQACCLPDNTCVLMDPLCCEDLGGAPGGPGSVCTTEEACCLPDNTCILIDPVCCELLGGTPEGPGSVCTEIEACCLPDNTCQDMDPLCCEDLGGTPQGPGTTCATTNCAPVGCTLTWGYWKTHAIPDCGNSGNPHPDETWLLLDPLGSDAVFYLSNDTYCGVLLTAPKGNPYYSLAHQFIAVQLNVLAGAALTPAEVADAFAEATTLFETYTPDDVKNSKTLKAEFTALNDILDQYNEGLIGPGHCEDDLPPPDSTLVKEAVAANNNPTACGPAGLLAPLAAALGLISMRRFR
jgi:hypothetical protein